MPVYRLPYTTKINWDPVKDLSYVINLAGYSFGLVVPADSPIKTMQEYVAYAKANPGKLTYGSPGSIALYFARLVWYLHLHPPVFFVPAANIPLSVFLIR